MRRAAIALALLIGLVGLAGSAMAAETPIPPAPTRWVTDTAGLLTPATRAALDTRLERYDHATGHQVIVWIGTTLGDAPLEDWCVKAFASWGIGRRGKDDGVAIFVFATDRRVRIEVGYGVEDVLPDAYAARIVNDVMTPALHAGHPDAAISGAVDQVLSRLGGEPDGVVVAPLPAHRGPSLIEIILGVIAGIAVLGFAITHPRLALFLLWNIMSGSRGGGDGDGGGFGGGGGRSGGGGASGGW